MKMIKITQKKSTKKAQKTQKKHQKQPISSLIMINEILKKPLKALLTKDLLDN